MVLRVRLLMLAALFCGAAPWQAATAQRIPVNPVLGPVQVIDVIDGDTVLLASNLGPRIVRLIGIDTPEVSHPEKGREPFGPEASAFTASLLPSGTPVWVELDLEAEDVYGRLLVYLYLDDPAGAWQIEGRPAVMVNEEIARAGLARVLTIEPNGVYADFFEAAVAGAQAAGRGMFGSTRGGLGTPRPVTTDPPVDDGELESVQGGGDIEGGDVGGGIDGFDVRIACILYDPSTEGDANGEWVELHVRGPVDTRGLALWDAGSGTRFPLPVNVYAEGDVIHVGNEGIGVWNNGGDTVYLVYGNASLVVDTWEYAPVRGEDRVVCR